MITVKRFNCNMLSENCYVVSDDTQECVIIDCGAFYPEEGQAIIRYIREGGLKPQRLLCTHGHFDHCMGNGYIYRAFGLKPEAHADDAFLMEKMQEQTTEILGVPIELDVPPLAPYLTDDDIIAFGNHRLQIIHTPGHTPGGIVLYDKEEGIAFSGDTLFRMSIGRTDFKGSSWQDMLQSLRTVIATLPDNTIVLSGHGPRTTIGEEKRSNPYLQNQTL